MEGYSSMLTVDIIQTIILGVISFLASWVFKLIWEVLKSIQTDMDSLSKELRNEFVRKTDMRDALKDIKDMLSKIFDKLDKKADK